MSKRTRERLFALGVLGSAGVLGWGFAGLPRVGSFDGAYSHLLSKIAVPAREAGNLVATTTFDIRGFDTLGEEFILFASAIGVLALLRLQRNELELAAEPAEQKPTARSAAVATIGRLLVGPILVLGAYVVLHGHLSPGGGFQGGILLSSAFVLAYLAGLRIRAGRLKPITAMELAEALGATGFVAVALAGLIFAGIFAKNILPYGTFGDLLSGGTIPLLNIAVGIEVGGAILVILGEFLDQRLLAGGKE